MLLPDYGALGGGLPKDMSFKNFCLKTIEKYLQLQNNRQILWDKFSLPNMQESILGRG